jgi:hypothetical protein
MMEVFQFAVSVASAALLCVVAPALVRVTRRVVSYQASRYADAPDKTPTIFGTGMWLAAYGALLLIVGGVEAVVVHTPTGNRIASWIDSILRSLSSPHDPVITGVLSGALLVTYFVAPAACTYGIARAFRADHHAAKDAAIIAAITMFVAGAGYGLVAGV